MEELCWLDYKRGTLQNQQKIGIQNPIGLNAVG